MPALTRFVLRHKALVALLWLVVAVAGVMTISGTTHRMTNSFAMPGQAFRVDNQIVRSYGNGGSQPPYVPVLTVPAGQQVTDPAVAAATGRAFAGAARAIPHARVADYATTHDPAFITRDGRSLAVFTTPSKQSSVHDTMRVPGTMRCFGAASSVRTSRRLPTASITS